MTSETLDRSTGLGGLFVDNRARKTTSCVEPLYPSVMQPSVGHGNRRDRLEGSRQWLCERGVLIEGPEGGNVADSDGRGRHGGVQWWFRRDRQPSFSLVVALSRAPRRSRPRALRPDLFRPPSRPVLFALRRTLNHFSLSLVGPGSSRSLACSPSRLQPNGPVRSVSRIPNGGVQRGLQRPSFSFLGDDARASSFSFRPLVRLLVRLAASCPLASSPLAFHSYLCLGRTPLLHPRGPVRARPS